MVLPLFFSYAATPSTTLSTLFGVGRAHECQRQCAREPRCTHWTWRRQEKKRCLLLEVADGSRPERAKARGFFSGGMGDDCRAKVKLDLVPNRNAQRRTDACVEYGVAYSGGDDLR